jgi:hypothetical protein
LGGCKVDATGIAPLESILRVGGFHTPSITGIIKKNDLTRLSMIQTEHKTIAYTWELPEEIFQAILESEVPDKITYAYYDQEL